MKAVDATNGGKGAVLFSRIVRSARERAGLTQAALAQLCGVRQPSVAHWESGKQPLMEATLKKIADALDVSLAEMLGRELATVRREENRTRRRRKRAAP